MLRETYAALDLHVAIPAESALIVELVYDNPVSAETLTTRLAALLPDAGATVDPVFEAQTDRFHFVTFPALTGDGQEAQAFEFARDLRTEMDAFEANPVLTDSLYGAAAIGATTTESFLNFCQTDSDDTLPKGWVHPLIKTTTAWQKTRGKGATVAVIDTGYSTHNELAGAIRQDGQLNLVEGGTDALDRFSTGFLKNPGHGTLVCSVVASRGAVDGTGQITGDTGSITGAAPEATILPIRAIRSVINFRQTSVPPAIGHATDQGADVIAMALGGPTRVSSTESALRRAVDAGMVIVCAAGNCWPKVVFPASYAANGICTAVAALNPDLTVWDKSGTGPEVTFSAPGVNVWGAAKNAATDPDNGIYPAQGTTLATSLTAGSAALWVAHHGGRDALLQKAQAAGTTVQAMFVHCATQGLQPPPVWGGSGVLGAGVLDVEKLLEAPLPTGAEAPPPTAQPGPGVISSLSVLQTHLANHDPDALADVDADLADYASELLWLSHRSAARARASAVSTQESVMLEPDATSSSLSAKLSTRPALRAALRRP